MADFDPSDDGWYAAHRRQAEAAYLAKLQAECLNCQDGQPNYMTWPDIHVCPMCHRYCPPARKEAAHG